MKENPLLILKPAELDRIDNESTRAQIVLSDMVSDYRIGPVEIVNIDDPNDVIIGSEIVGIRLAQRYELEDMYDTKIPDHITTKVFTIMDLDMIGAERMRLSYSLREGLIK